MRLHWKRLGNLIHSLFQHFIKTLKPMVEFRGFYSEPLSSGSHDFIVFYLLLPLAVSPFMKTLLFFFFLRLCIFWSVLK